MRDCEGCDSAVHGCSSYAFAQNRSGCELSLCKRRNIEVYEFVRVREHGDNLGSEATQAERKGDGFAGRRGP